MRRTALLAGLLVSVFAACGSDDTPPAPQTTPTPTPTVTAMYALPASLDDLSSDHYFDHPYPSDFRMDKGLVVLGGFPNPRNISILTTYIQTMDRLLDGFSPVAAGLLRWTGEIDATTLPQTPKEAIADDASVELVDVDPNSSEHGTRKLVSLEWRADAGVYWPADSLAFMPTIGFPLRPRTQYALVVTNKVKAKDGTPLGPGPELRQVLGLDSATGAAATEAVRVGPALTELASLGITTEAIAGLAVFTTDDPTAETFAIADDVKANVAKPTADPTMWTLKQSTATFDEYLGNYGPSPNYQQGKIPYEQFGDGGGFEFDNGVPKVADTFNLRFSLMVPNATACPVPADGYPIVMYAHGTGGDYRSYVSDGTGKALAGHCVATMGVDQIFHGTRPGAPPDGNETTEELLFFNFQNVVAARTNTRQSAIDEVQRARLFTESKTSVPAAISKTGAEIHFDASKLMFFGHSQGGLNGPLFLASDGSPRGGVLSGSSALLTITLLEKTQPSPSIVGLVDTIFLGLLGGETSEVDYFHPAIAFAQTAVDVVDPIHYARYSIQDPRAGFKPKSIYQTEGINPDGTGDNYAPPHGIEAHAIALGLPLQIPFQHAIVETQWGGPQAVMIPASGLPANLAGGDASGVLAQWPVPKGDDGHFVVFDVPAAREQAAQFVENLGDDPKGRVPAPGSP